MASAECEVMAEVNGQLDPRSKSPVKPDSEAVEPSEDAKCVPSPCPSSSAYDADQSDTGSELHASQKSSSGSQPGVVTDYMVAVEEGLKQRAEEEFQRRREERSKEWSRMEDEDKAERFKRLQHLLNRSNMYTEYLLARIKRQEDEDAKKRERRTKKMEKLKKKEEEEQKEAERQSQNSNLDDSQGKQAGDSESGHNLRLKRKANVEAEKTMKSPPAKKRQTQIRVAKASGGESQSQSLDEVDGAPTSTSSDVTKEPSSPPATAVSGLPVTAAAAPDRQPQTEEEESMVTCESESSFSLKAETDSASVAETEEQEEENEPRMFEGEVIPEKQPILMTGGILRPYQIDGFTWLRTLYENGVNGILADEMGLGKTVQAVAMFAHMVYMGVPGPFMVCAPLSTLPNWYNEFCRFCPSVPVMLYHGSKEERKELRQKILVPHKIRPGVSVATVIITSYEVAMMDQKALQKMPWRFLVVDEGHRLKNTHCRLINALRVYNSTNRLLLTGTPLQNNLAELWSLLNFLLPEIFDDLGSFEAWFDVENLGEEVAADKQKQDVLSMMHQILTPFMLRRLKTDVDLRIPPKKEVIVYAPLRPLQKEFYSALIDKTIFSVIQEKNGTMEKVDVDKKGRPLRKATQKKVDYSLMVGSEKDDREMRTSRQKAQEEEEVEAWVQAIVNMNQERQEKAEPEQKISQLTIKLRNVMMQLRKCCSHPFLLEHPLDKTGHLSLDERIISESGKMLVLDRMLKELKARGHKVLIFSQMTKMLDLLEDFCVLRQYGYCRLDGSMNIHERRDHMAEYQKADSDKFVFLLSTRAGGLGINLTAADTVIIYDSDWNPQCDLQAQDRCHRIGQTKPVMVYRLVTANTIDQRIVERAAAKRKLEKMVIHQGKFKSGMKNFQTSLQPLSSEELLQLLNSKDHQSEVGEAESQQVISDKDLHALLDRSELEVKWRRKLSKAAAAAASTTDSSAEDSNAGSNSELPSINQPPSPTPSPAPTTPSSETSGGTRRQSLRRCTAPTAKKASSPAAVAAAAPKKKAVPKRSVFKVVDIDEDGFTSTKV